MAAAVSPLA